VGDEIAVLPSGFSSTIKSINAGDVEVHEAYAPMSVSITLEDDIDVSRGDMIVKKNNQPESSQEFDVMLCWLNHEQSRPKTKYTIVHTSNEQRALIKEVIYKVDINTYNRINDEKNFRMNDIGRVKIRCTRPLMTDAYRDNRNTGSIILIDENTNETVAAGMVI
jgi:sulfate adenylyltransferase subunit 1